MNELIDRQAAMLIVKPWDDDRKMCDALEELPAIEEERWVHEIREAYERAKANPYIRKPLSRAMYEVWHRYDASEVERR